MVGRRASFYPNQAGRQFLKERQHVSTLQLTADNHLTASINPMYLKNRLRDVQSYCRDRLHG
jgi:hypothetical protein